MEKEATLRQQLIELMEGGNAHASFEDAVKDFPAELRGKRPKDAPHTPWEELEHLRIAQYDILEFSRNPHHKSPKWPEGYWPNSSEPPDDQAWDRSIHSFSHDLQAMCALLKDPSTDLFAEIPSGDGQTLLREILLAADHNAYHVGQLVLLRRMLGSWSGSS